MPDDYQGNRRSPGFTSYEPQLRKSFLDSIFVEDNGDIDVDEEFSYDLTCGVAHPGPCAEKDMDLMPTIHICAKRMRRHLVKYEVGSMHVVLLDFADGSHLTRCDVCSGSIGWLSGSQCLHFASYSKGWFCVAAVGISHYLIFASVAHVSPSLRPATSMWRLELWIW